MTTNVTISNEKQTSPPDLLSVGAKESGLNSTDTNGAEKKSSKPISFHLAFLSMTIMVFIVSLDTTTLAVAVPIISNELNGTTIEAFWASICFMLAVAITQPLYTSTSDVLGRIIPLYVAYFLFAAGSLIFALAPNMATVIVGRVIQGLGGSGLDVLNEIITADLTTMKERPMYLGILAIPMAAGALLGPIVGSLFAQYVSWRWLGWINLPLIGVSFLLSVFFLRLRPITGSMSSKLRNLDWVGMPLFLAGCTAFTLPLSWAGALYPWDSWRTLLPLLLGACVLVAFALYEHIPKQPVIPHRMFASATSIATFCGAFLHGLVVYNLNTYLALFYQAAFLLTPLQSAVTLLPMNILALVFSVISPIVSGKLKQYRPNIWAGWVFLTIGCGILYIIQPDASTSFRTGIPVVTAAGVGILFTVLTLPAQASVQHVDDTGYAVGLLVFFRLFGGLVGLAIGSTIFSSIFQTSIANLGTLPNELTPLQNSQNAISFIPQLRIIQSQISNEVLDEISSTYTRSFGVIWIVLTVVSGMGLMSSLSTKEISMDKEELGRQQFEASSGN